MRSTNSLGLFPAHPPYEVFEEKVHSANQKFTQAATALNDALSFVPEDMTDRFYDGLTDSFMPPSQAEGDSRVVPFNDFVGYMNGYRMLRSLQTNERDITSEQLMVNFPEWVGWNKLTAANIVTRLANGTTKIDDIRKVLQTNAESIFDTSVTFPTAFVGFSTFCTLVPYLAASKVGIKPSELTDVVKLLGDSSKRAIIEQRKMPFSPFNKLLESMVQKPDFEYGFGAVRELLLDKIRTNPELSQAMKINYLSVYAQNMPLHLQKLRNVDRAKRSVTEELKFMTFLINDMKMLRPSVHEVVPQKNISIMKIEDLPISMQVDWEILSPGTELEQVARAIVETAQKRSPNNKALTIDFTRLTVLENLRNQWDGQTDYVRGSLRQRGIVRDGETESPDEYILLLLKNRDGSVQHVVGDSPIVGPHALYIFRQETAFPGSDWETVFRLEKKDARRLGARALKHTWAKGSDMVTSMTEKATTLITCTPSDFHRIRFDGPGRIRLDQTIGSIFASSAYEE